MTSLQRIQLDMLKECMRICDELRLTCFLVCGSALGAVKYGGFIPWDDDLDIAMRREEYEIFIHKASAMLPSHLFLQNYHTDPCFPRIYSKLRNSNTTYVEKGVAKLPIHHGVYIDIFPLDGYPDNKSAQLVLEKKKSCYKRQLGCALQMERGWKSWLLCRWNRVLGYHKRIAQVASKYDSMISSIPTMNSVLLCNHGNWQGKMEYASREQYGEGTWAIFEGLKVRVPERYDEYLTQKYGDWRAELPPERQVGHHYYEIMDLTKPYTEYIPHKNSLT